MRGSSVVGTVLVVAILVGIGAVVSLYTVIHANRTKLWKFLGAVLLAIALFVGASVLSASVWVFYARPQSIGEAIHEFGLVLLGHECG